MTERADAVGAPDGAPPGWTWQVTGEWGRWQLDAPDGMMLAIVERPMVEVWDRLVSIPLGWRWRNSWGGDDGGWTLMRSTAMRRAEVGALVAESEVEPGPIGDDDDG